MSNAKLVQQKLDEIPWKYADYDRRARLDIEHRIAAAGRTVDRMLTYSELVDGVTFQLPNVRGGESFQIDIHHWGDFDRGLVGDFLGRIDVDSFRNGGFFASALVIGFIQNQPSESFFSYARQVGLLTANSDEARLEFWMRQIRLARAWYQAQQPQ